jgi:hypothetical protein
MLITFLQENLDTFVWQTSYMPDIPTEVIEHKLDIDPSYKLIKQKERGYTPERCDTIQQEVNKLLEVGFIRSVDYPNWLANPIVDYITLSELLSFLHAYSGYHQISLAIDDDEKTTFITSFWIFCYTKMAFGLKNR